MTFSIRAILAVTLLFALATNARLNYLRTIELEKELASFGTVRLDLPDVLNRRIADIDPLINKLNWLEAVNNQLELSRIAMDACPIGGESFIQAEKKFSQLQERDRDEFPIENPSRVWVKSLATRSSTDHGWQIYVPADSDVRLVVTIETRSDTNRIQKKKCVDQYEPRNKSLEAKLPPGITCFAVQWNLPAAPMPDPKIIRNVFPDDSYMRLKSSRYRGFHKAEHFELDLMINGKPKHNICYQIPFSHANRTTFPGFGETIFCRIPHPVMVFAENELEPYRVVTNAGYGYHSKRHALLDQTAKLNSRAVLLDQPVNGVSVVVSLEKNLTCQKGK